jgi:hypothetical protein
VQPAASAGPSFIAMMKSGTFHGMIPAHTPTGRRPTRTGLPNAPGRSSLQLKLLVMSAWMSSTIVAANTCVPTDSRVGQPFWRLITSAIAGARFFSASDRRRIASARSSGAMRGNGPLSNASRAAATARSTSDFVASGTRPITSSVDAERTSMRPFASEGTHRFPMKSSSCSAIATRTSPLFIAIPVRT